MFLETELKMLILMVCEDGAAVAEIDGVTEGGVDESRIEWWIDYQLEDAKVDISDQEVLSCQIGIGIKTS